MKGKDFSSIREKMKRTQKEMSEILGVSLKAIQSYEQGWRRIPAYVERQALLLLAMKTGTRERISPCWEIRGCPWKIREACPAWEFESGHICWFINGTICQGEPQGSWSQKRSYVEDVKFLSRLWNVWGFVAAAKLLRGKGEKNPCAFSSNSPS
jgi:DNA-binding XRE family transcriptional regulator